MEQSDLKKELASHRAFDAAERLRSHRYRLVRIAGSRCRIWSACESLTELPASEPVAVEAPDALCPSFTPRAPQQGLVFGVRTIDEAQPSFAPLAATAPVDNDAFAVAAPYHPAEVFRIAAPCRGGTCKNYDEGGCRLASQVAATAAPAEVRPCPIRDRCLWWHQEGAAACGACRGLSPSPAGLRRVRGSSASKGV